MKGTTDTSDNNQESKAEEFFDEIFEDYLKGIEKTSKEVPENSEPLKKKEIIKNANNWFLVNTLSPEIQKNENKKRQHKDWLMWIMGGFLLFQFALIAVMICYVGYYVVKLQVARNPFADSTIKIIFTFIGTYITSVIVELIAILNYIVQNVFDTSVAGMVNNFKDNLKDEKQSER